MGVTLVPKSNTPIMSSLVQQAWKAKRRKASQGLLVLISPAKELQTVPTPKEKPTYSPLLSKRLHKRILLSVIIPPRKPFPPPLAPAPPPPRRSLCSPRRLYPRRFTRPPALPRSRPFPSCAGQQKCK